MEGLDEPSAVRELVVLREDRQRTRNRLAQRRHRERKRFTDGREHDNHRRNPSSHTDTENQSHDVSSNPMLPTPPDLQTLSTLPGLHLGLMPSSSSWTDRTDLQVSGAHHQDLTDLSHLQQAEWPPPSLIQTQGLPPEPTARRGSRKAQPTGSGFMHWVEGDYWAQTYNSTHELWDPAGGNPMAHKTIQIPSAVAQRGPQSNHQRRSERCRSSSDGESSSWSDTSKRPVSYDSHTPVSLQPDHDGDSSQPRRKKKTKDRHEDPVPQRQASTKTSSTATPVSAASNGQRRDSTARYEATLTDDDCLEARLERVLHIVEENGFDSIDSMASTYYTSELLDDSFLRPIQATSRTRRLRSLISDLQASHKSWNGRERRAFAGEVVRSAEGICSDELGAFQGSRAPLPTSPLHRRTSSSLREPSVKDQKSASLESKRSEIARRIRDVLSSPDICEFLQKDQAALQSSVPETWSMMMELARRAGLEPHERVMVACINVYLLTDEHSS